MKRELNNIVLSGILGVLFIMIPDLCRSQSTLEFNQVLKISTAEDTVPSGKVWKVSSYFQRHTFNSGSRTTSCTNSSYHHPFYVDDEYYYIVKNITYGSSSIYAGVGNELPLWLPAGSRVRTACAGDFVSVIEFNVSP